MATFVLLTRLTSEEANPQCNVRMKEKKVSEQVRQACPNVKWVADYAVMGPYDYLDIFKAPDTETAMKVSAMVRSIAGAHTEIWPATSWKAHDAVMRDVAECVSRAA